MSANSPNVTGISPAEGPPGTKVKIRGENLGRNAEDLLGKWNVGVSLGPFFPPQMGCVQAPFSHIDSSLCSQIQRYETDIAEALSSYIKKCTLT